MAIASQQRAVLVPKNPEVPVHDADGNLVDDARWHYTWDAENRLIGMETNAQAQSAGQARTQLAFVYDSQGRRVQKMVTNYPRSGLVNVRRDYFTNTTLSGTPDTTVSGGNIDNAWFQGQGLPYSQPFSYRVTAALYVPSSGSWTPQVNLAYGGARLYVNNTLVIDAWTGSGNLSATLALAAGQAYSLRYEFNLATNMPGGASPASQLNWSGPGVASQRVPNAAGTTANPTVATTRFVYDGWNLLAELDGTGAMLRSYTWGPDLSGSMQGAGGVGGLIGFTEFTTQAGQPAVHFPAYDGNGNVTGLVQAADGALSATYDYNAFGERVLTEGVAALLNPFRFSCKFQDDETGLCYFGFRYYNSNTGRWPNRDPIEESGGENLYGFVGNDPISRIDPTGLWFQTVLVPKHSPFLQTTPKPVYPLPPPVPIVGPTPSQFPYSRHPDQYPKPEKQYKENESSPHAGEFHLQKGEVRAGITEAWKRELPLQKSDADRLFERFWSRISFVHVELRDEYKRIKKYIQAAPATGIPAPEWKSWPPNAGKCWHIDLEVVRGRAFVNDRPSPPPWGTYPGET